MKCWGTVSKYYFKVVQSHIKLCRNYVNITMKNTNAIIFVVTKCQLIKMKAHTAITEKDQGGCFNIKNATTAIHAVVLFMEIGPSYLGDWESLYMMTSSNGNIFRVTGPLCGEFTGPGEFPTQRPVTRSFDVFFDLRLNNRLSKQWLGWWFETQCNGNPQAYLFCSSSLNTPLSSSDKLLQWKK